MKQRRKQIGAKRKGFSDQDEEREGIAYGPGSFEWFYFISISKLK